MKPVPTLLLLGALAAPAALGQARYDAVRSNTQGFFVEGGLGGTSVSISDGDRDRETDGGGALGVRLGYGFNRRLALYAAVGGAAIKPDDNTFEEFSGSDTYGLGNVDLGLEVNFGNPARRLVPYLNVALSGVAATFDLPGTRDELTFSGGGLTLGGGLKYHFAPGLALNGSLQGYGGTFNRLELGGEKFDDADFNDEDYRGARLGVGLTWYPGR